MEGEKSSLIREKLIYALMFLFTGAFSLLISFLTGKSYELLLRNTVVSLIIAGVCIFMLRDAAERGQEGFSFDNYFRRYRFIAVYFGMIILSGLFSLVPNECWPYMSFFVILSLFSNAETGMVSGIGFTMISVMLEENGSYSEFFMYVLAGIVAIALFRDLKEDTAIGLPVFISLLIQGVLLIAFYVLFQNRTLSLNILTLPFLNVMINLAILLVFLNMFGVYIIRKNSDAYLEINDTEYPLLVALKGKNEDEYYRAIHTGYLSEKVASQLGFNDRAAKTCAYYNRIGVPEGKTKWEELEPLYVENSFPKEAIELLHEYTKPQKGAVRSGESLTVRVCATAVAAIRITLKKDKGKKIDYDKLIDNLFLRMEKDGELKDYQITFGQYAQMRSILKKEKSYYDLLR